VADDTDEAIEILKSFLKQVQISGIRIERAVLFGSYAKNKAKQWSDIDVAIVSPDFSGNRFCDARRLIPFVVKTDSRIEMHLFRPEDFCEEEDDFVSEIVHSGVDLSL